MINQLRIYTIPPDNKDHFLDRFRDHAARIMARYDFRILSMWTDERNSQVKFVYLLAWDDAADMDAGWSKFMADTEWSDIKKRTSEEQGDFVLGIEDLILTPCAFSSALGGDQ